jgi:hypothetical protein
MKIEFTHYYNYIYSFRYEGNLIVKVLKFARERSGFRFITAL